MKKKEILKLKVRVEQYFALLEANVFSNFSVLDAGLNQYYHELFFFSPKKEDISSLLLCYNNDTDDISRITPLSFFSAFLSSAKEQKLITFEEALNILNCSFFKIQSDLVHKIKSGDQIISLKKPYTNFILQKNSLVFKKITSENETINNQSLFENVFFITQKLYFINGLIDYFLSKKQPENDTEKTTRNRIRKIIKENFDIKSIEFKHIGNAVNEINTQLISVFSQFIQNRPNMILPKTLISEDLPQNYCSYQRVLGEIKNELKSFELKSNEISNKIQFSTYNKFEEIITSDLLYDEIIALNKYFLDKKTEIDEKLSVAYLMNSNLSLFTGWCAHFLKRIIYLHSVSIGTKQNANFSDSIVDNNARFSSFDLEDAVSQIFDELNTDNNIEPLQNVEKKFFKQIDLSEKNSFFKHCDKICTGLACLQFLNSKQKNSSISQFALLQLSDSIMQFVFTQELPIKLLKSYNKILQSSYQMRLKKLNLDKLQWSEMTEHSNQNQLENSDKTKNIKILKKIKNTITLRTSKETKKSEHAMTFQEKHLFEIEVQINMLNDLNNEIKYFRVIEDKWGNVTRDKKIDDTCEFSHAVEEWIGSIEKGFAESLKTVTLSATSVSYDNNSNFVGNKPRSPRIQPEIKDDNDRTAILDLFNA